MRRLLIALSFSFSLATGLVACARANPRVENPATHARPKARADAPDSEVVASDTSRVTPGGVHYTVPAGWTVTTREGIAIVSAPEGDLHLAIVEMAPEPLDPAIAEAWQRYGQEPPPHHHQVTGIPSGGWAKMRAYAYDLPAGDKRVVVAEARWGAERLTVLLLDAADATREKRSAQFALLDASVQPASYVRASFAGKTAHVLDRDRLDRLDAFIERARVELAIPGAAVAITQGGQVILARGYGLRELGKPAVVDAKTLFRIASNTKPLTSLLQARLVDAGKLRWEQPVVEVYPDFKLADAEITASTRIEHLLCACTGLPRSDMERLFEFAELTPELVMKKLSTIQPTTSFGQTFQYSNQLAAAAGYVAGYALEPSQPLRQSYDRAMQRWVFDPLDMRATTFEAARALRGNHATGHTWSIAKHGQTAVIDALGLDRATDPIRPAGGAWSNLDDLIKYVQLELDGGVARNGQRLVSEASLLKRRDAFVAVAPNVHYGIGLEVDRSNGTPVIGHSGYTFGYHSRMRWLPEHGVGTVFLSNADAGDVLGDAFERYLLELLFDAEPKAQALLTERGAYLRGQLDDLLQQIAIPADAAVAAGLAAHYRSDELGRLDVEHHGGATIFDFGEWKSEVASVVHDDKTVSFMTVTPGYDIFELVARMTTDGRRELFVSDAQHVYVFVEENRRP